MSGGGRSLKGVWAHDFAAAAAVLQTGDGCRLSAQWHGGAPEGAARLELPSGATVELEVAAWFVGEGQLQNAEGHVYQGAILAPCYLQRTNTMVTVKWLPYYGGAC